MGSPVDIANDLYRLFTVGDIDGVMDLLSADVRWELIGPSEIPYFGARHGADSVREFFQLLGECVDVEEFRVDRVIEFSEGALAEGLERATFRANGASYTMRWCHVIEVCDGKIVSFADHLDTAAVIDAFRAPQS